MKLNNEEFKSIAEAINYASLIASDLKVNYYLPFSTDDMVLQMSKGEVDHIWMHCNVGGVSFRLSITSTEMGLYTWTDSRGWQSTGFKMPNK